jgi:NAD(P)-dependent dehydrogenase (short-subunit alcohol dehydrogenase family)
VSGRLDGARVIVTGASRGIGRAVAEAVAAEGGRLVVTATRRENLAGLLSRLGAQGAEAHGVALDLADRGSVDAAASEALAVLGRVEGLVNNASLLGVRRPLADYPLEVWDDVIAVNVTGTLLLTQRVLPAMSRGAAIVNVTSGAAGRATWGAYAVSKLALDGVTGMLREELAGREIRCVGINPGGTRTAMRASAYPDEDPATVPHPSSRVDPFIAVLAGHDPGPHVEAAQWTGA